MLRKIALFVGLSVWTTLAIAQSKVIVEAETYFRSEKYFEGAEKCSLAYFKLKRKGSLAKKQKADMAFKTGECYRFTERYREANEWYDRAIQLEYQELNPEVFYNNGEMLRTMGEFDKAIKNFEEYRKLVPSDPRTDVAVRSSNDNKDFIANKTRHVVENQTAINKDEMDMAPMFADRKETKLYFASSRSGSTGKEKDPRTGESYMDLWVSEIDKKGNWGEPTLVDKSGLINTEDNEGTVCFDGRGKKMFFTRCPNEKTQNLGCDIWIAESKGKDEWGEPVKITLKTSDTISVGHPCVTDDGNFLIFASDMPGGQGGRDLWYVTYDKKNDSWSAPKNLGPEINTKGNELFPTFGKNGELFFASDGLIGVGGLDIFEAQKVEGQNQWENPKNLGHPINSVNNDYALIQIDEKKGYFTSERKGTNGEWADIYMYRLPPNLFDLKVIVSELGDKNKKIADVRVMVKGSDGSAWEGFTRKDGSVFWDKKADGARYVNSETSYSIAITKDGYHEDKTGSKFTTLGLNYDQNFIIEMALLPKKPIRLPEVRYPLSKWTFVNDSTINSNDSLMFVYNLLQEYPGMVLELSSHTDARDTDKRNQVLSENRAKACYKFLVEEKGVDPRRIVPVGKGEAEPATWVDPATGQPIRLTEEYINQFKTSDKKRFEMLHQLNRRTEGKVLSMEFDPNTAPQAPQIYREFQQIPK
ncbi:MAG: OmpA family protein [Bacteroidota bacterium]